MNHSRKVTCKILEAMDEGILDPRTVAGMCLEFLAEAEVAHMARMNDLMFVLDEEDDDE